MNLNVKFEVLRGVGKGGGLGGGGLGGGGGGQN